MALRTAAIALTTSLLLGACAAYEFERSPAMGPARIEAPKIEIGRSWSFRVVNGYNSEVLTQYREQVVESAGAVLRVVRTDSNMDEPITELYSADWNWQSKARAGVSVPTEYAPALQVLPFPLEVGKAWSQRTTSSDPYTGQRFAVRLEGRVVGWERITVPAGTFDAVLITRTIFVEDGDPTRTGTQFLESDWYVPSVGRVVRAESSSGYDDLYQPHGRMWVRGDWTVLELAEPAGGLQR